MRYKRSILLMRPWRDTQVYEEPAVLIAKRVTGEEEVPEGVVAVLTPDAPDVLSHVSVRARNMKARPAKRLIILENIFAVCHERCTMQVPSAAWTYSRSPHKGRT